MNVYTVVYTDESCIGNQTHTMLVRAPDLETAYEYVNSHYPEMCIDQIFLSSELGMDSLLGY